MNTNLNALKVLTDSQKPIYELSVLFDNAGFEFYVVGGTIRDLVLGVDSDDFDICTNARPEEILGIVKMLRTIFGVKVKYLALLALNTRV